MSTPTNQSNEDVQKAIAHLQCSDGDFHYTAEKVAKLVKEARADAFEESAKYLESFSKLASITPSLAAKIVRHLAAKERAK